MTAGESGAETLARLAHVWAGVGPPVIVFNKSHSGSRLLARLLRASDVFMGSDLNESEDAADMLRLVCPLVERHYPHYPALFRDGDATLAPLIESVLTYHLRDHRPGTRWGWKLCETLYILPVLHRLFPGASYLHLIRDGRDVAFCDHVAPEERFWRKVYFDTGAIAAWHGRGLLHPSYTRNPHVFNARHWVNSVTVARHYGAMIGERYFEVRYEDLVHAPDATARQVLHDIRIVADDVVLADFAASVTPASVGKHRRYPARSRREALAVLHPTLEAFGYTDPQTAAPSPRWKLWR